MKKASVLCLLFSLLLLCLQSRSENSEDDHSTNNSTGSLCKNVPESVEAPKFPFDKNIVIAFWTTVAMVAILCNVLIIHVVRVNPHMRTTANCLIVNMAFGDLIGTISVSVGALYTIAIGEIWKGNGVFGTYVYCRLGCPLYYICILCSIFSIAAITIDRFLAVTRPLKYKHHSSWTKYAIPAIWATSLAIPANYVVNNIVSCEISGKVYCILKPSPIDANFITILGFAVPHVVIVVLYMAIAYKLCTRRVPGEHAQNVNGQTAAKQVARKVTCMIICILVAFEVSWCPVLLGYVLPYWRFGTSPTDDYSLKLFYKVLMISNGIFNAVIYAVFNENFREAFKETLRYKPLMRVFGKVHIRIKKSTVSDKDSSSQKDQNSTTDIPIEKTLQKYLIPGTVRH